MGYWDKRRKNDGLRIKGTYIESRSPDVCHDEQEFGDELAKTKGLKILKIERGLSFAVFNKSLQASRSRRIGAWNERQ